MMSSQKHLEDCREEFFDGLIAVLESREISVEKIQQGLRHFLRIDGIEVFFAFSNPLQVVPSVPGEDSSFWKEPEGGFDYCKLARHVEILVARRKDVLASREKNNQDRRRNAETAERLRKEFSIDLQSTAKGVDLRLQDLTEDQIRMVMKVLADETRPSQ